MSSPSAAQPNTAVIPLPPGFTLEQYQTLQGHIVTIAITVAVAFGIIAWDYFALLPDEIALYRAKDKRLWRTPTTWFFILLRYSGIAATLPSLFFTSAQSRHCQVPVVLSQVGAVLAVASSGIIFCYRVFAIWSGNKLVHGLISSMFLVMMACWIAVATQYSATTGPSTPFGSNCQMHDVVSWAPISYASSVAFDTTVLLFTLAKLHPNLTMAKSAVGRQIFRDTLMYFSLTTVTNITVLSIQSLGTASAMIKPTAIPFSTVMTVTMGSRVYLNLKLLEKRRQREVVGIPLSMPLSSQGSSSMSADRSRNAQDKSVDNAPRPNPYVTPYPSPGFGPYTSNTSPYVPAYPSSPYYNKVEEANSPELPPKGSDTYVDAT